MAIPGTTHAARQRLVLAGLLCAGLIELGGPIEFGGLRTTWAMPVATAPAAAPENVGPGVQVDWSRSVLRAAGSSAADLFAASAEIARVKAERLARSRAEARLRRALQLLSHEARWRGKVAPEVLAQLDPTQAKVAHIEYAATGSVSLQLELALAAKAAPAPKSPAPMPPAAEATRDGGPAAASEEEKSP